ncbi:hypothetical protein T09_4452, partial [Trichinella sp. T9]
LTLFLEKNRIFDNFEMSWAIDCCFHVLDEKCFFSILKSFFGYEIKDMQHTNVRITGTIRRNLQITTISHKLIQLHMEKTWRIFSNIRMEDVFKGRLTSVIIFIQNGKSRYTTLQN